jgi:Catalase
MAKASKPKGFGNLKDPEQYLVAGPGGATHQTAEGAEASLTTNQGVIVADNQNTLKSGGRGPSPLEDFPFREKITHFDHEPIPERIVHARGSGAHGYPGEIGGKVEGGGAPRGGCSTAWSRVAPRASSRAVPPSGCTAYDRRCPPPPAK